jgi:hypothetical protein
MVRGEAAVVDELALATEAPPASLPQPASISVVEMPARAQTTVIVRECPRDARRVGCEGRRAWRILMS